MQKIILKGAITGLYLDPNGEVIASISTTTGLHPIAASEEFRFEPSFNFSVRAADLGNPPVGATVEAEIRLS